jgi:organic radical activating enzyme
MNKTYSREQGIFHITNVCNLTCKTCDVYSNRNFKGHFKWNDYANKYIEWSKKILLKEVNIFGGEPYTNPDLINWVSELKKYFADAESFNISTNGTYLNTNINLSREIIKQGFWLDVSIHDPAFRLDIENSIEETLSIFNYKKIKKNTTIEYVVDGKKLFRLWEAMTFRANSLSKIENKMTFFRRSDPIKAHTYCMSTCAPNVVFHRGNIFKCSFTSISQDLLSQFDVEDYGSELLKKYKSADPFDTDQNLDNFFINLDNHIDACQLCPEREIIVPIWPMSKKKTVL